MFPGMKRCFAEFLL